MERDRLVGVDAARGAALLGMMSVHVFPSRADDGTTTVAHLVAAGRSAALFAVLAGVGVALATGAQRPVEGRERTRWSWALVVRGVLVGLVGLLLGGLGSGVAVVLPYYALLFVVAVPLLRVRGPVLTGLAVGAALVVPVLSQLVRPHLAAGLVESPTVPALLERPAAVLETLLLTGYYPVLAWTAYLCAGLALGRLPLGRRRTATAVLGAGVALAVGAAATSTALLQWRGHEAIAAVTRLRGEPVEDVVARGRFGTVPTTTWWWLATDAPHSTTPLDLLHTTGTSLAVLGLCLLVATTSARRLLAPLAAAGSMTLSLYSAHVVVLSLADPDDHLAFWAAQAVAALVVATLWRRVVGRGPLEAAVAAATRRLPAGIGSRG